MRSTVGVSVLVGLAVLGWVVAAAADDCRNGIPADVQASIQSRVDSGVNVGIAMGLVTACGTSFYSYGTMTDSGNIPVDEDTLFEIGSSAKPFTALLLADAVERGDLSLDETIDAYLPASVVPPTQNGYSIRFRQLATHTSGLPPLPDNLDPADWDNPYADYTVEQLYDFISGYELHGMGSYVYSNLGMGLLGNLLERYYQKPYETLVIERIADVIGMPDTRATLSEEQLSRTATGYRDGQAFPIWQNPTLAGAGCLLSTVRDLCQWVSANLGLIDTPLYDAMKLTQQVFVPGTISVGLGWHIRNIHGKTIIEHHGATGGCWSYVGFVVEDLTGVVVLTNTYADIDDLALHILDSSSSLQGG
jgi:D-alanyl-D-alanine-carboxypeptidase/D-alanyl-D-alanine-endopeptidase